MEKRISMSDFVNELKAEGYIQQGGKFFKDGIEVCLPCGYVKKDQMRLPARTPEQFKNAVQKITNG